MNTLLEQLLLLTGGLALAAEVSADTLAQLLRYLAAALIQQNPGLLPVPPNPALGAQLNDAAASGAELAAQLDAQGVRLRFTQQAYLAEESAAELPAQVFGPFIDAELALVQFSFFESAKFLRFDVAVQVLVDARETMLLLPAGTQAAADDPRSYEIAAGTVWLAARLLVPNATGFVALRVARGSLRCDEAPKLGPDGSLTLPVIVPWTLELEPEAAPAPAAGSDGDALALLLPTLLRLGSAQPAQVEGALALDGFGSALRLETQLGAAVAGSDGIGFPFDVAGASWSIEGNRSPVFAMARESMPVAAALWTLPLASVDLPQAGEAAHGGSLQLLVREGLTSRLAGASGRCVWHDTVLRANARGLELQGRRAGASIAADVRLWGAARSALRFGGDPLAGLRHASRRSGADIVTLQGGEVGNQWDLPRTASGQAFAFDGVALAWSLIAEADGLRRMACVGAPAQADRQTIQGFALENLYLHLHPARRMAFVGSGASALWAEEGTARLLFDVRLAQPILPDPYAANWQLRHLDVPLAESAFSARLHWLADGPPALVAQFAAQALLAFPHEVAAQEGERLRVPFDAHLEAGATELALLDLSSRDHLFGVALEPLDQRAQQLDTHNRLALPLRSMRLLMQPQVHWEPVDVVPNPDAQAPVAEQVVSRSPGGLTLLGARSDTRVPVLPGQIGAQLIQAAQGSTPAAALFALPFGLRAFVRLQALVLRTRPSGLQTVLHQPVFGDPGAGGLLAAMQLRLVATGTVPRFPGGIGVAPVLAPNRGMPGQMLQTDNLVLRVPLPGEPLTNGLPNVLTGAIAAMVNSTFENKVPLHQADLSGYGLSAFSRWRLDPSDNIDVAGVSQVRFDVMLGRTAYEVIEVRSRMLFAQCRVVRTIVMERRNNGQVQRFDSGWKAIDDGEFKRYVAFDTGVVPALRNIRRIRILDRPEIAVPGPFRWQPVLFDADAQVLGLAAGGANGLVPVYDHPGYIQLQPVQRDQPLPIDVPTLPDFEGLLAAVGGPVGGPLDCAVRLGGTLAMHLASLQVDRAVPDPGQAARFFVAVYGTASLPRAAQWSAVRIDGKTQDVSPVDARRGMPAVRRANENRFIVMDPADALTSKPKARYGLLMSTPSSRVLYPQPTVSATAPGGGAGQLLTDPPRVADPYALSQSSGAFPRAGLALQCKEAGAFAISAANDWTQLVPAFEISLPAHDLAKGAEWGLARQVIDQSHITLALDTLLPDKPWGIAVADPEALALALTLDSFSKDPLFFLKSALSDGAGALPGLGQPSLIFGDPLADLKDLINTLNEFVALPLDMDVDVSAGSGPSPSFIVRLDLKLRIPSTLNERIDIGVGKFHGLFEVVGQLEAALNGSTHGKLSLEFTGDVQQGILPPVLYAGGIFRFALQVSDTGPPLLELGLGTTTSLGGDLIAGLVALEATVRYGYTLIPQTLQPGVMLGLDARAKLLGGLLGLSFSADAMARVQRLNLADLNTVTLWCDLRVAATVQVAWFLKEEKQLHTQFEQEIPLGLFTFALGANPWFALASEVI